MRSLVRGLVVGLGVGIAPGSTALAAGSGTASQATTTDDPPSASPSVSATPTHALPPEGAAPLDAMQDGSLGVSSPAPVPVSPLESAPDPPLPAHPLPYEGVDPFDPALRDRTSGEAPPPTMPLGEGPPPAHEVPPDPRTVRLVRSDLLVGSMWRLRQADAVVTLGVEVGQRQGWSARVHTSMIVVTDRDTVRALEFPLGAGALYRSRLGQTSFDGSVGLTAGILVHRAASDQGVVRRVDPDFQLPLRLAWTPGRVGASLALVTGYSVRERTYERRGGTVWNRHSVRIGLFVGVHWDVEAGRLSTRRSRKASRRDTDEGA